MVTRREYFYILKPAVTELEALLSTLEDAREASDEFNPALDVALYETRAELEAMIEREAAAGYSWYGWDNVPPEYVAKYPEYFFYFAELQGLVDSGEMSEAKAVEIAGMIEEMEARG